MCIFVYNCKVDNWFVNCVVGVVLSDLVNCVLIFFIWFWLVFVSVKICKCWFCLIGWFFNYFWVIKVLIFCVNEVFVIFNVFVILLIWILGCCLI